MSRDDLEALAHRLADAAATATLPAFRTGLAADDKGTHGDFDPVTEADRAAERVIRELLAAEAPGHAVLGEEFDARLGDGDYEWVIDPIDGTRSFLAGVPLWTTIVGLRRNGAPFLGLVDQPYVGDRFWSGADRAWHRDPRGRTRAVGTRACASLADATLMTTAPSLMRSPDERARYDEVENRVKLARYGADGYAYCLLAAGSVDLVVEAGLAPYDIVGIIPIVEAAGGVVTSWTGGGANQGGAIVAAGDPRLHEAALAILAG